MGFTVPGPAIPGLMVPGVTDPGLPLAALAAGPAVVFALGVPYFRWVAGTPYLS